MAADLRCPDCGADLDIVTDGRIGILWFIPSTGQTEERLERRPFAACTGCEYCLDLTDANPELLGRIA